MAEATQERKLLGVGSTAVFGWASPCARLLDHLVRLEQERRRDREAQGLGGLQVDDEIELHRPLHRQVPWLGAFRDAIHIVGRAPEQIREARSIAHQAPFGHGAPLGHGASAVEQRREPVLGRKVHDLSNMPTGQHIRNHEERVGAVLRQRREGAVDLLRLVHPQGVHGHPLGVPPPESP
jgi:hypothetical protein